ncbi:DUF58 domain-containing protein [Nocardiopsis sediminis]|uniref:DUF58 domain-containing protein n=1 Tax=Nocardiopsis sediminis TaxID=1778267 RepID=A0ABV8FSZ3_9ACTN
MPTKRGLLVAAAGLPLLVAGVLLGYREIALVGAVALAAVAAATAAVRIGRPAADASVRRSLPVARTGAGTEVAVRVTVEGAGRGALLLRERVHAGGDERWLGLTPSAGAPAAAGRVHAAYRVEASRRGVVELGPLRVERTDPFGLASAGGPKGAVTRLTVHPRWRLLRALPARHAAAPDAALDNGRTGTLTFRSLRGYVPGDDLRHIHWRSTARHDRLLVREYADTAESRITVLLDDRDDHNGPDAAEAAEAAGTSDAAEAVGAAEAHISAGAANTADVTDAAERLDAAAEAAACILATAVHTGVPCSLALVSGAHADDRSGLPALLDLLAAASPTSGANLDAALHSLPHGPAGGATVLVGPTLTSGELQRFAALGGHGTHLVAALVGPHPHPEPRPGVTVVSAPTAAEFTHTWDEAPWTH